MTHQNIYREFYYVLNQKKKKKKKKKVIPPKILTAKSDIWEVNVVL